MNERGMEWVREWDGMGEGCGVWVEKSMGKEKRGIMVVRERRGWEG
jgi:hypothetical protein